MSQLDADRRDIIQSLASGLLMGLLYG